MQLSLWRCSVLVENDVSSLIVIHPGQTFHEIPNFLPFVIIAFKEVDMVLDRDDDCSALAELGLCGQSQVNSCGEGDNWGGRTLVFFFMMAQWTIVQNPLCLPILADCGVFEVSFRFVDALGKLFGIFIHIIERCIKLSVLGNR